VDFPRLLLAQAAARHVRVVLTGEGADEVFGGYVWHRADRLLHSLSALPLWLRRLLLVGRLGSGRWPWTSRIVLTPAAVDLPPWACFVGPLGSQRRRALFSGAIRAELEAPGVQDGDGRADPHTLRSRFAAIQHLDLGTRLPGHVTESLDRMTMAFGLEARVPFLDHELVELVARIPARLQLRRLREKYLVRRAVADDLPRAIAWRRKRRLRAPVGAWLRGRLPAFAEELLSRDRLRADGYFDPDTVHAHLGRHRADPRSDGQLLRAVPAVQLWHDLFRRRGGPWARGGAVGAPHGAGPRV
jgi:asparagine synthase (glutamine-hydrolysing)